MNFPLQISLFLGLFQGHFELTFQRIEKFLNQFACHLRECLFYRCTEIEDISFLYLLDFTNPLINSFSSWR
jgi:hypothetical protein